MSKINDGDPAFPVVFDTPHASYAGMSLLDYFAAAALPAFIIQDPTEPHEAYAQDAYDCAEAMLAERERRIKEAAQ